MACDGKSSCQGTTLENMERVRCDGTRSCVNANIKNVGSVRGDGDLALTGATLENVSDIQGAGYRSLTGATIDSGSLSSMIVTVLGKSSGNNTSVICRSGSTCSVTCKGDGCEGLLYVCLSGATCNVEPVECFSDNSVDFIAGVSCPTFTNALLLDLDVDDEEFEDDKDEIEADIKGQCYDKRECYGLRFKNTFKMCMGEEVHINEYIYL